MTSISLDVADLLAAPDLRARVELVFAEACNLVTDTGQRFSLVSDRIGDGPLNAVLSHAEALCVLDPGSQVTGDGRWLILGHGWRVDLRRAQSWDPFPNYHRLAIRPRAVMTNVAWLHRTLPLIAPPSSFASLPAPSTEGAFGSRPIVVLTQIRANQLTRGLLAAHRHHNLAGIQAHARQLAGLGPGLTPAGDDWLGGWLVGLHVRAAMAPDTEAGKPLASSRRWPDGGRSRRRPHHRSKPGVPKRRSTRRRATDLARFSVRPGRRRPRPGSTRCRGNHAPRRHVRFRHAGGLPRRIWSGPLSLRSDLCLFQPEFFPRPTTTRSR